MLLNQATALLQALDAEHRRVVSAWRATLLLRRVTADTPADKRRWNVAPRGIEDTQALLRRIAATGQLRRIPRLPLYEVTAPYAPTGAFDIDELLLELNPYAAVSHLSALAFHMLTDQLPKYVTALSPKDPADTTMPIGTVTEDWWQMHLPPARHPSQIQGQTVTWTTITASQYFGLSEYHPRGYPIRVTDPERTLIDGILQPSRSGGIANVFRAWATARESISVNRTLDYVDRLGISMLRQRVGYIMETLGLHHKTLEEWAPQSKRGGSSKLIAAAPYSSTYSERWNLSLNADVSLLQELEP